MSNKGGMTMKTMTELMLSEEIWNHSMRVAKMAYKFAQDLGCPEDECKDIFKAGLEHDFGKLLINKDILEKPGKLTQEEIAEVKRHTSDEVLNLCEFSSDFTKKIASEHHKKYTEICKASQIIAICDVFDALTSKRCYKEPMSVHDAFDIMQNNPRQDVLNKELLSKFISLHEY